MSRPSEVARLRAFSAVPTPNSTEYRRDSHRHPQPNRKPPHRLHVILLFRLRSRLLLPPSPAARATLAPDNTLLALLSASSARTAPNAKPSLTRHLDLGCLRANASLLATRALLIPRLSISTVLVFRGGTARIRLSSTPTCEIGSVIVNAVTLNLCLDATAFRIGDFLTHVSLVCN